MAQAEGEAGSKRRLVIKEMCLENFKSYGGMQRIGPFHHCFSSVVGPNGSGKSNVIDAMLFVFGKRANQLRLNKVSELIHNSSSFKNLKHTRVDVYFHEIRDLVAGETFEIIPGTDLKISRAAYKDNSSEYFVNDKRSSFSEVTKILKGKDVDLDNNRFLILQGEVEQISLMPPKAQNKNETGLLEYLEDIIGTNVYVEDIENLSEELQTLNEQRSGIIQRVKAVQKEKDSLESSKQEAESYLQKEKELLHAQIVGYHLLVRNSDETIKQIEEEKAALQQKIEEERGKKSELSEQGKQSEKECEEKRREQEVVQSELSKVNGDLKKFERKDIKLREDLKHVKQKLKKLEDKVQREKKNKVKLESELEALSDEIPELNRSIESSQKRLKYEKDKLDKMQDSFKGEIAEYRTKLEKVHLELAPWEKQKKEVQGEMDVAAAELKLIDDKVDGANQRLSDTEASIKEALQTVKRKGDEMESMQSTLKTKKAELASVMKESQDLDGQYNDLSSKMQVSRGKVEEKKAALNAESTQSQVVKALMAAQSAGKLKGVHGRLGDLGATKEKYDVAVSTACPGLDHIVVETISDAQRCVEFLKKTEVGRATFLILEKQKSLEHRMESSLKVAAPHGAPRLLDLIQLKDPAHKVAFYYALRDTVLAENLEEAQRVSYQGKGSQRWRVVTLQGQIIETSGTMSGGGKPRRGRILVGSASQIAGSANTDEIKQLIAEAEGEFQELSKSFERVKQRREQTKKLVQTTEDEIGKLQVSIPKATMEVEAAHQLVSDSEGRLVELREQAKLDPKDKKRSSELRKHIEIESRKLADLTKNTASLSESAAALEKAIDDVGGPTLKNLRRSVSEIEERIVTMTEDVNKKQIQVVSNKKQIAKGEKNQEKVQGEIEEMRTKVQEAKEQVKAIEEEALVVMQNCQRTQEILNKKKEEVRVLEHRQKKLKKTLQDMRTAEMDIEHEMEDVDGRHKEQSKQKKKFLDLIEKKQRSARDLFAPDEEMPGTPTEEEMADMDLEEIQRQASALESAMADMKPDMNAISEYKTKEADYSNRVAELDASTASRDTMRGKYDDLRKRRLDEFMAGFNIIALKLKEMYQMITLGGDAELELVDSLDPFSEGIVFSVRPPKKSWKNIRNLSGGEKTLSSLALVFALHHFKPTPLYVMDEIDAALDFRNVSIVAHYIKERTKNAQFVIISLRNNMFELADRLVGIYKTHNTTKSVTIDPEKFSINGPQQAEQQPTLSVS